MANLPKEKLYDNVQPFLSTGIDCFGSIKVKVTKCTRNNPALNKQYGVIFACLTMRALHRQSFTEYLIQAPVFLWNSALRVKFNF